MVNGTRTDYIFEQGVSTGNPGLASTLESIALHNHEIIQRQMTVMRSRPKKKRGNFFLHHHNLNRDAGTKSLLADNCSVTM